MRKKVLFFFIFRNCPQKSAKEDAINIVNALKVYLKKMKQKRPLKKDKNQKIKKKRTTTKSDKFFYFIFRNCPQKGAQWDAVYILSTLKVFFKRIKQKRLLKVPPPMLAGVGKTRFTQLPLEDWVLNSADFWILESIDNINTFLTSYWTLLQLYSFILSGEIRILFQLHLVHTF